MATEDRLRTGRRGGKRSTLVIAAAVWFICILLGAGAIIFLVPPMRELMIASVFIVAALLPIGLVTAAAADASRSAERRAMRISHQLDEVIADLRLSDTARAILSRRQEHELLRRAIEQDLAEGQWDSAHTLIQKLCNDYGWREEGRMLADRLERDRATTFDRSVHDAVDVFERLLRDHQWSEAYAEAARLEREYPDSPRIAGLKQRVDTGRLVYRRDLERRFHIAATGDDPEEALAILRELDLYLAPTDAPRFEEEARRVIARVRDSLAERFKSAIHDHHWDEALRLGQRLMVEFPNTKMATEVRNLLPTIEERVGA